MSSVEWDAHPIYKIYSVCCVIGEGAWGREPEKGVMGLGGLLSASLGLYTYDYL